jgi:hypothetical protein
MGLPIVQINAAVAVAPAPITVQETGVIISQGATTLAANTLALLTSSTSLSSILAQPLALSGLSWSGGTVVATTSAAIVGRSVGDMFITTIANATPSGYNGTWGGTVTGANTFTFSLTTNPGVETVPGTYTVAGQGELVAQNNTYWGQGTGQSVYVLELGPGDQTTGPAALGAWIALNPNFAYSYLVPRGWDGSAGLLALIAQYEATTAKTYFFITTSLANYASYPAVKNILLAVDAPGKPLTEFSLAATFQVTLNYAPTPTNKQTQLCFAYLNGVTPYPQQGNTTTLLTLKNANVGYVDTGAEGGVSNTLYKWGRLLTGVDFTWWYAADWVQLNTDQAAANAVIVGSNNPENPLYYNQQGINTLQDVVADTISTGIASGLLAGSVLKTSLSPTAFSAAIAAGTYAGQNVVNAVPFSTYVNLNPNDYANMVYNGISVIAIPQNGFQSIIFNLTITNLIASL